MDSVFDAIADDLANKGYAVVPSFLSPEEVRDILSLDDFKQGVSHFKKAGIGNSQAVQIREAVRGDYIKWLDREKAPAAARVYLNRLQDMIAYLNRALFLSLKDFEVHMTVYPVGSFYKRHLDQFKKNDHRKLSVICYLNEDWTDQHGGQLRVYTDNGSFDVLPTAGTLVCFRSDLLEHEVLPATRERLSITGWILDEIIM